jgi:hypothetical protein
VFFCLVKMELGYDLVMTGSLYREEINFVFGSRALVNLFSIREVLLIPRLLHRGDTKS